MEIFRWFAVGVGLFAAVFSPIVVWELWYRARRRLRRELPAGGTIVATREK